MLRNFAANITGNRPGKHCAGRFLKQYSNDLICFHTTSIDGARVRADSAYKYMLYFELLAQKVHEYDTQAENIYNMDEKGFLIGNLTKGKQIFSKQRYERDGHGSHVDQRFIEYCSENKIFLMTHQLI